MVTSSRRLVLLTLAGLAIRLLFLLAEPAVGPVADERTWTDWARTVASERVHFSPFRTRMIFHPPPVPVLPGRPALAVRHSGGGQVAAGDRGHPAHSGGGTDRDDGLRRARRAGRGRGDRVLSRAHLVLGPLLGRERVPRPPVVGVRALVDVGRAGTPRGRVGSGCPVGPRHPRARDGAVLPAGRGALARVSPRRERRARAPACSCSRRCWSSRRGRTATGSRSTRSSPCPPRAA